MVCKARRGAAFAGVWEGAPSARRTTTYLATPADDVLPEVSQLLQPHGLNEIVARAVRHSAQHVAGIAVRGHHCERAKDSPSADTAAQRASCKLLLTDDRKVHFQAHQLQQAEPVHICLRVRCSKERRLQSCPDSARTACPASASRSYMAYKAAPETVPSVAAA